MRLNSRSGRLVGNLIASVVSKLLITARQLLLVPLFIQGWGVEVYGKYLVLSAIPTVMSMTNLGVGTAAGARVALEIAGGKMKEASRTLFAGLAVAVGVGLLLTFIAAMVPFIWPNLNVEFKALGHPQVILAFLILSMASDLPNDTLLGVFNGVGKAALGLQIMNGTQFARFCVMAGTLVCHQPPVVVIVVDSLVNILATSVLFIQALRSCPDLITHKSKFDPGVAKSLLGTGLGFQASPLWQAILFQGSLWLANATLGAAGAATWGTLRALARSLNQLYSLLSQTIYPELQLAIGKQDFDNARRMHGFAVWLSTVVGLLVSVPLILAGPAVYHIWTRGKLEVPFSVWPFLALTGVLNGLWWTSGVVHRAMNRPWYMNLTGVGASVISVATMYVCSVPFKITGFAIGAAVFEAIMAVAILGASLRLLHDNVFAMVERAFGEATSRLALLLRKANKQPA